MTRIECPGLDGSNPLHFLAAIGSLRVVAINDPNAKLNWAIAGGLWSAVLHVQEDGAAPSGVARRLQNVCSTLGRVAAPDPSSEALARKLGAQIKKKIKEKKEQFVIMRKQIKEVNPGMLKRDMDMRLAEELRPQDEDIQKLSEEYSSLQAKISDQLGNGIAHFGDNICVAANLVRAKALSASTGYLSSYGMAPSIHGFPKLFALACPPPDGRNDQVG